MTKPPISEAQAATLAKKLYQKNGTAARLPGEWDANFHLQTEAGDFVLKVMHAEQETAVIDLQCQALKHLETNLPTVNLPRVVPTVDGLMMTAVELNGRSHLVWLLTYIPGQLLAHATPHTPELLHSFGKLLGEVDSALADFEHPASNRDLKWDLAKAGWIRAHLDAIKNDDRRALVERFLTEFETAVYPQLQTLRQSIIHNDANDYNVVVSDPLPHPRQLISLFDFGDMMRSQTINNLAIAIAYAILGKPDPLASAAQMLSGYHSTNPITEQEAELLFNLICTRLCVSVVNSAIRKIEEPDDPYIVISETPAWEAIEKLQHVHPRLAHYTFRAACGWTAVPFETAVITYLQTANPAQLLDIDISQQPVHVLDLSVGSTWLGANPANMETPALSKAINSALAESGCNVAIGRYNEARLLYSNDLFVKKQAKENKSQSTKNRSRNTEHATRNAHPTNQRRTVHLGLDLWCEAGTAVYAPFDGTVRTIHNNTAPLDYGPLLILEHQTDTGQPFFTLYGHLSEATLTMWQVGDRVKKGTKIAGIGAPPTNGDWPPHLHVQLILDLLELNENFPGVAFADQRNVWLSLSPDPNLMCQIPADQFPKAPRSYDDTLATRKEKLGGSLSLSYQKPLKMVRGWMQYLVDENGRFYLDVYNNVPHVGHSHPRVVEAAQKQLALLNTNTRYLHDNILTYAERLTALMPDPLSVCFFVNSGSEANELALRLARTHTNQHDMLVLEAAYHGHTSGLIDISPYKFDGPGGRGAKPWVHQLPIPDDYRGQFKRNDPQAGEKYARQVQEKIEWLQERGRKFAGFICETLPSVGGQIVLPPNYLNHAYDYVRQAGGVCIADEVQVGFGRLGTHFWGFEKGTAVPDIVVLGKPIGNGFPLAAVVTTPEIAASFNNGMEFFSTFGGNPVSCAAGTAVLDIVQENNLQTHALTVGNHLLAGLQAMVGKYDFVGDARGSGLFLGLELVRNHDTLEPAPAEASYTVNRLREHGILAGTDGPHHNVIKIRPPMSFSLEDADFFLATLDAIMQEDALRYPQGRGLPDLMVPIR